MSEQEQQQEGQKTVVAFVAGLLIGGLLVWVFSGDTADSPTETGMDAETEMSAENDQDTDSDTANSDSATDTTDSSDTSTVNEPTMEVGEGSLSVSDQTAGSVVTIRSATFPTDDGWVAVRTMNNGTLGNILGAARYSKSQGLVPEEVELLAPTRAGSEYAVVFFTENGDRKFDLATDVQIDAGIETFTAE